MRIQFRVLGTLEVVLDEQVIAIGSRKQRMLLCVLAAHRHSAVSVDALAELLWSGARPASFEVTLRGLVSRLRSTLGPAGDRLVAAGGGYLLVAAADEVDRDQFSQLVRRGQDDLAGGLPEQAVSTLETALALWRGTTALVEIAETEQGMALAARLTEERATAVEALAEANLDASRPAAAVQLLKQHLDAYPLRENAWEHLLLALYRMGRQSDALQAYRQVRETLREELGVEPGQSLRRLHSRILTQDPDLGMAPVSTATTPGLPSAITPLIGRDDERAALAHDLLSCRLLTLTGMGGVGKTRLALEVARDQAAHWDDVKLIELGALDKDTAVDDEVVRVLGAPGPRQTALIDRLARGLANRRVLLILDNCEHVLVQVAGTVEGLLSRCPGLTVLATSREPLGIGGETVRPVPPLPLPSSGASTPAELFESPAVTLFCQRARQAQPGFGLTTDNVEGVRQICCQLDGIPLALELAAARLRALSTHQVAERLNDRFGLLTSGTRTARPRHQTLRATMDWSYDLLSDAEQAALQALTVFPGDFDAAAAVAVVGPDHGTADDLVFRLIDKSLVEVRRRSGESRYELLDTVRAYGSVLLDQSGQRPATLRRHREHFRQLAAEWRDSRFVSTDWSRKVAADEQNLRVALVSALADADARAAGELLNALWPYWTMVGCPEDVTWFERTLDLPGLPAVARVEASIGFAVLMTLWGLPDSTQRANDLLSAAARLADESQDAGPLSWAHYFRGEVLFLHGDRRRARQEFELALSLVQQPPRAAAFHHSLGWVALADGDPAAACVAFERAIAVGVEGDLHVLHAQAALACVTAAPGNDRAGTLAADALAAARRFQLPAVLVMALVRAAQAWLLCQRDAEAAEALRELFLVMHGLGTRGFEPDALDTAGLLAHRRGEHVRALRFLAAAERVRRDRSQLAGFALLGPELAAARAAAVIALGEEAAIGADSVEPVGAFEEARQWLTSLAEGVGHPDSAPSQDAVPNAVASQEGSAMRRS